MGRKAKSEAEKLAEFARSEPFTNAALSRAASRLARKNAEFGRALIAEVLDVGEEQKRFLRLENEKEWLDMASISALAIVESLENEIRVGEDERHEDALAAVPSEMIRKEVEGVSPALLEIVEDIRERNRQINALARANQEALQKLALLLQ